MQTYIFILRSILKATSFINPRMVLIGCLVITKKHRNFHHILDDDKDLNTHSLFTINDNSSPLKDEEHDHGDDIIDSEMSRFKNEYI